MEQTSRRTKRSRRPSRKSAGSVQNLTKQLAEVQALRAMVQVAEGRSLAKFSRLG